MHKPSWEFVLPVDTDGLSSAVPLVVIEKPTVLRARHMVMSVRLHYRDWSGRRKKNKKTRDIGDEEKESDKDSPGGVRRLHKN